MKDRLSRLDFLAIVLSVLCVVHCLATPVVLLAWPLLAIGPRDWFHAAMACVLLIFALAALLSGYRLHRQRKVLTMGALGVSLLFAGLFVSGPTLWLVFSPEALITLTGSLLLIGAHVSNYRHHRHHHHHHHHPRVTKPAPTPHRLEDDPTACSRARP